MIFACLCLVMLVAWRGLRRSFQALHWHVPTLQPYSTVTGATRDCDLTKAQIQQSQLGWIKRWSESQKLEKL